jgi:hypothetical protein
MSRTTRAFGSWNEKRGPRALPLRKEVDPVELQKHLGSLNMIECLPDLADFRYRLIGTNVVQAYGRDSTGKTVRQLYADTDAEYCDFLLHAYHEVATRKIIGRIRPDFDSTWIQGVDFR